MTSDEERVDELRSIVASDLTPYYDTHFNLLRWIQIQPTAPMQKIAEPLRHHLLLRKCLNMDSMHEKTRGFHPVHKYWPSGFVGLSGVIPNCMVLVEQAGYIDYEGIHNNFSFSEIVKAKLFDIEMAFGDAIRIERETGQRVTRILVIDAAGVEYTTKLIELLSGMIRFVADFMYVHYADMLRHIVIVNVPSWANALLMIIKPLMPKKVAAKIKMLSTAHWRDEIKAFMDPSVCPTFWNNEDHSEFKLVVERPPKVTAVTIPKPLGKLDQLNVKAGKVQWMEFRLEKGDALSFSLTSNSSFGFAIVLADGDNDENNVFNMRTVFPVLYNVPGPVKIPIEDTVIAPQSGLYKMWFSNTRGWWFSVHVHHKIRVIKCAARENFIESENIPSEATISTAVHKHVN